MTVGTTARLVAASQLNQAASAHFDSLTALASPGLTRLHTVNGAQVLDAGIEVHGSLQAGLLLAQVCLGGHANVTLGSAPASLLVDNLVLVQTDHPASACLGGQYAGWPVSVDKYFAMASGPMRSFRGREKMLEHLGLAQTPDPNESPCCIGVLESDVLPGAEVIDLVATECHVPAGQVRLAVAPSTSIAGSVQVVARSIETALHKIHELGFDVTRIVSATGQAPLPPPAKPGDTVGGIGRTNDAILYGGHVTLWVDADDEELDSIVTKIPSGHSSDHGKPFAEIFQQYDYDFYKVDPMLFSPAVITLHNLRTGRTLRAGEIATEVLRASFGMRS